MNRAIGKQMIFVVVLAVALVAFFGVGLSLASDGETIPHGGYNTGDDGINPMTDACLQCHDVHEAAGEYVLMREPTVTGVCSTCHNIYLAGYRAGTGVSWPDPGYPSEEAPLANSFGDFQGSGTVAVSTTSWGGAYEISLGQATTHEGHRLGMSKSVLDDGAITYADGNVTTNANYIPGGSLLLTRIVSWKDYWNGTGNAGLQNATASCDEAVDCSNPDIGYTTPGIPSSQYQNDGGPSNPDNIEVFTGDNAAPSTESATSGLYCASCHGPHGYDYGNVIPQSAYDNGGTVVGNYWFGTGQDEKGDGSAEGLVLKARGKLLSSLPNHDQTRLGPVDLPSYIADAGNWCGRCHDKRVETDLGNVRHNNHPSEFCLQCHGIYNGVGFGEPGEDARDFPHVGAKNLLQQYPDELCLRCHGTGAFPLP